MKKLGFMGILAAALMAGVLFTACENTTGISYSRANAVGSVTATKTADGKAVILTWDAVDDVSGYHVYIQQEGKKTVVSSGNYPSNSIIYKLDDTSEKSIDADKWTVKIGTTSFNAGNYRFGITTEALNPGVWSTESEIVWTAYVQI